MLSKDATLASKPKIVKDRSRLCCFQSSRLPGHNLPGPHTDESSDRLANGQRPRRQIKSLLDLGCLASLWPLAVASPPMSARKREAPSVEPQNIAADGDRVKLVRIRFYG